MPSPDKKDSKKDSGKQKLEDRIHRHLNDKNDHISDEDIRDVVVGSSEDQSPTDSDKTIAEKAKEMEKEVPKDGKATPWDTFGG